MELIKALPEKGFEMLQVEVADHDLVSAAGLLPNCCSTAASSLLLDCCPTISKFAAALMLAARLTVGQHDMEIHEGSVGTDLLLPGTPVPDCGRRDGPMGYPVVRVKIQPVHAHACCDFLSVWYDG